MARVFFRKLPMFLDGYNNFDSDKSQSKKIYPDNFQSRRLAELNDTLRIRHDWNIVWFDTKIDPEDLRTQRLLFTLSDNIQAYSDLRSCIHSIEKCEEIILLIISGKCAAQCLQSFHELSSIDMIIIYCAINSKYMYLTEGKYKKVLNCVTSETDLIECVQTWITLKCQNRFYTCKTKIESPQLLSHQTALFLANYLLPVYIETEYNYVSIKDLTDACRIYYSQNSVELNNIEEFERTYTSDQAILWYTRNSFIYKALNKALRMFHSSNLLNFAFYIHDLCTQLRKIRMVPDSKTALTLYRGAILSNDDIKHFKLMHTSSLISINGFLSTSKIREVAMNFAFKKPHSVACPLARVLFEINTGVDNSPCIFADISNLSVFPEESEVLFSIGTIFSIDSTYFDESEEYFHIKLSIATDNDYQSIERLLKSAKRFLDEPMESNLCESLIGRLLSIPEKSDEQIQKQQDRTHKFSLIKSTFNYLWNSNPRFYRIITNQKVSWMEETIRKTVLFYSKQREQSFTVVDDNFQYKKSSMTNFEPVLFFYLPEQLHEYGTAKIRSIFSSQYHRFITCDLTVEQVQKNLDTFCCIFYISSKLPSYMTDNYQIRFYEINISEENQNKTYGTRVVERLTSELLHGLGMFYWEQAEKLVKDREKCDLAKSYKSKAAKCYEQLADQSDEIIKQYAELHNQQSCF